jgi:RNA ligase (TIGR02306 family)
MSSLIVEVVNVDDVAVHDNADSLEIATIKGWYCVVGKDQFKAGDKAIYIPIDSVISEPTLSTIFPANSKIKPNNGRIKTIKIRGSISQGLLLPLDKVGIDADTPVGTDVAAKLGITKFEPPLDKSSWTSRGLAPTSKRNINPNFSKYTGIENFKNYSSLFEEGEQVVITEKIHGTNFRCGYVPVVANTLWKKIKLALRLTPKYEFVYGSHNVQLNNILLHNEPYDKSCGNLYADMVMKYRLRELLKPGEVLYGEIYGDGIQKNYSYGCKNCEHKLVVFDIMRDGQYSNSEQVRGWCVRYQMDMVPILYEGEFDYEQAKALTIGDSVLCPSQKVREGIVIKPEVESNHPNVGRKILKLISDQYLLGKNSDFH